MQGVELYFFYLLAAASPLSIAAINVGLGGLTLFFIVRLVRGRYRPPAAAWALVALFAWSVVCAIFSPLKGEAFNGVLNFWSWTALLTASALPWGIRRHADRFATFLALSVCLTLPASLLEFFLGMDIWHQQAITQRILPGQVNAYGFFSHHLTYAGVMAASLFFLAGRAVYATPPRRPLQDAGILCAAMNIVMSMARTYYVALAPALAVLLWRKGRRRVVQVMAALAVVAALGLAFGPAALRHRVASLWDMGNASNAERVYLWVSGLKMVRERPITGWGMGTYPKAAEPFKAPYAPRIHYPGHEGFQTTGHCHNLYLMMAVQCGLPGLALFLLFVVLAFKGLARQRDPALRYGVMAAFTAFLVGGLFEFNGGDAEVATLMFFLLGLGLAPSGEESP